jgi:hypothetical protein
MNQSNSRIALLNSPARRLSMSIIGCLLVVDLIWLPFSALRISASNLFVLGVMAGLFFLAGPIQRKREYSPAVSNFAVELYILILFGCVGFVFSYLAIESGWAVRDDWFVSIDNALGFDWRTYTLFVLQNDLLRPASFVVYILTPVLVGFAVVRYCQRGDFDRASEIVAAVIVGGVICVVISGIAPSVGGAGFFPADSSFYQGYPVVFDSSYKVTFFQLREREGMDVFLLHPAALIAFPSYHACLALLVILVFWGEGSLGWLIVALSVGSMFSLPVQGGHYLSDVLGGLLTGAVAFWVVKTGVRLKVTKNESIS